MAPASSEKQRKLMGMALAIKRGELSPSQSGLASRVSKQMSEEDLSDFAKKRKRVNHRTVR